jgi:GrpB-like predicted nucleotidyltransferase (UPF0157 family)
MGDKIEIVPYQARWRDEFLAIAAELGRVWGDDAMRIDHIGSTAVVGLAAKDVIDVQVSVVDFANYPQVAGRLAVAGYGLRPDNVSDHVPAGANADLLQWEKRYVREKLGMRRTHIHVRAVGRANWRFALLFRDYLRADAGMAGAYAEVKRRLAVYHVDDREAYVTIKDPIVDMIMRGAEFWVEKVGWVAD